MIDEVDRDRGVAGFVKEKDYKLIFGDSKSGLGWFKAKSKIWQQKATTRGPRTTMPLCGW